MSQLINLAFIGTYPQVSDTFMDITSKMDNVNAITVDASFETAVKQAKRLESGLDAILSRGGTADYIKAAVGIPVIFIPISSFDVVKAISKLDGTESEVAFIHYYKNLLGIEDIEEMFHIRIHEYLFENYDDIESSVRDACKKGIKVVIGGTEATKIANGLGMQGVAISAGYEAVGRAISETMQVLFEKRREQNKSAQLQAAFASLVEGIVVMDENRRAVIFNSVAEKIFKKHYNVNDIFTDEIVDPLCTSLFEAQGKASPKSYIREMNGDIYAVSHTPVMMEQRFVGVVSRYEDITKVQNLEQQIRKQLHTTGFVSRYTFADIIAESAEMSKALEIAKIYAQIDSSILIEGESGTGKELFAQSIHNASKRKNGPFVAVNCTAIPENLLESELFGYEYGAFTGAKKEGKAGLFELAHGGTLFLDEIGEITEQVQARLLRVLQEREIMRVGGNRIIPVDVRVISATNKNLQKRVIDGTFRVDLYYRLNVLYLRIPPLRERTGDVALLCEYFAQKNNIPVDDEAFLELLPRLEKYRWPGNVRELESVVERYSALKPLLTKTGFSTAQTDEILGISVERAGKSIEISVSAEGSLKDIVEKVESEIINKTLSDCDDNQNLAANMLGIGKTTLWRKAKRKDSGRQ